ncbi:MAG: sugar-transfer associated ATP-grasp domain-containing protein, partial [Dongia sp.]
TGRLGPASDLGKGPRFQWHDRHPLTGGQIAGRVLPFWPEAMALAVRAHAAFGEWVVIGWDVAILADGPKLIEGNKGPDVDLIQRPLRAPIGSARFGALLAHNLERSPFMRAGR